MRCDIVMCARASSALAQLYVSRRGKRVAAICVCVHAREYVWLICARAPWSKKNSADRHKRDRNELHYALCMNAVEALLNARARGPENSWYLLFLYASVIEFEYLTHTHKLKHCTLHSAELTHTTLIPPYVCRARGLCSIG